MSHSSSYDYIKEIYEPIKKSNLIKENSFCLPHEDKVINTKEVISKSDLVIAEVSLPSTGQGIELGWAEVAKKPILCIYKRGMKITSALNFITDQFIEYEDVDDMINKVESYLKNK